MVAASELVALWLLLSTSADVVCLWEGYSSPPWGHMKQPPCCEGMRPDGF